MKVLTFEEWCEANSDIVQAVRDEGHPCGQSWAELATMGLPGADEHIESKLRSQYDAQVQRDKQNLAKWNECVNQSQEAS